MQDTEPSPSSRGPPLAALAIAMLALLALPSASAGVEGEITYDLRSLEDAEVHAELDLTDETASQLRASADRDDDGDVSSLEAAGAEIAIDNRLEGRTDAYALDGAFYTHDSASVSVDGLKGPVSEQAPIAITADLEASVEPGDGPHVFTVHGLPANLTATGGPSHVVKAPPGYEVHETDGFATSDPCQATSLPEASNGTVTFAPASDACQRSTPGLSGWLVLALAGLAGLAARRLDG